MSSKFLLCLVAFLVTLSLSLVSALKPNTFKRLFVVVFENQPIQFTLLHKNFARYAHEGTILTDYYAITHPSQPNYLSIIAGSHFDQFHDRDVNITATNIVDLLEPKGLTWKSYQEAYQGECNMAHKIDTYYRKHNPFISFENIYTNPERCANIVNSDQLWKDIEQNNLPNFMFYTPDINNDCHNTGLSYCDEYLPKLLDPLLQSKTFMDETLILVTFDEDSGFTGNHIYSVLLGNMVQKGGIDRTKYTHFSILKTVEENWQLDNLGRGDVNATAFVSLIDPSEKRA